MRCRATAHAQSFNENWLRSRSCVKHQENDACNLAFILFVDINTGGSCKGLRIFSRILPAVYPQIFLNTDETACPVEAGDWRDKHGYFFCVQEKYYSLL